MRLTLPVAAIACASMALAGCSLHKPAGIHSLGDLTHWKSKLGFGPSEADSSAEGPLALAQLSERRNQADQARRLYQIVIQREPRNPFPHQRLGVMSATEGKFEEAHQYFQESLALGPDNHKLLSDIGYCFYLQHRLNESEEFLRRALQIEPNDQAACNNMAIVLGEMDRYDECLAMFEKVGTEAEAYANLGFLLAQRGEFDRAKANYNRALTLDPELRPAGEALAQLVGGRERWNRALAANGPVRRSNAGTAGRPDPHTLIGTPPRDAPPDGFEIEPAAFIAGTSSTDRSRWKYPAQPANFELIGSVGVPRESQAARPQRFPESGTLAFPEPASGWPADIPPPPVPYRPVTLWAMESPRARGECNASLWGSTANGESARLAAGLRAGCSLSAAGVVASSAAGSTRARQSDGNGMGRRAMKETRLSRRSSC